MASVVCYLKEPGKSFSLLKSMKKIGSQTCLVRSYNEESEECTLDCVSAYQATAFCFYANENHTFKSGITFTILGN